MNINNNNNIIKKQEEEPDDTKKEVLEKKITDMPKEDEKVDTITVERKTNKKYTNLISPDLFI